MDLADIKTEDVYTKMYKRFHLEEAERLFAKICESVLLSHEIKLALKLKIYEIKCQLKANKYG